MDKFILFVKYMLVFYGIWRILLSFYYQMKIRKDNEITRQAVIDFLERILKGVDEDGNDKDKGATEKTVKRNSKKDVKDKTNK